MLAPFQILDHLKARLAESLSAVQTELPSREQELVSVLLALPRAPLSAPNLEGAGFQFMHPGEERIQAGYGSAREWRTQGPERLPELARSVRHLNHRWLRIDQDDTGFDAFAMVGFAADPEPTPLNEGGAPNCLLWIPRIGLVTQYGQAALVLSAPLPNHREALLADWGQALDWLVPQLFPPVPSPLAAAPTRPEFEEPDPADWNRLVECALKAIDAGDFQKVVLARRLDVRGQRPFEVQRLMSVLRYLFPSCQLIHLKRGDRAFVSATPERLLRLRGRQLEVDAIAGTAPRGETQARDQALAQDLCASDKNLREHRHVIDAILEALEDDCEGIQVPAAPEIMALNNAQHLWSPIRAETHADTTLFDLADRLHPTPATNGQPRAQASEWLRRHEPFDRGWYTGVAGTLAPDLTGELWVLLRCARLCGDRAELYAGAGIVQGSDPDTEWSETQTKLQAMLSALQYA